MAKRSKDEKFDKLKNRLKKLKERVTTIRFELDELTIIKDNLDDTIQQKIKNQTKKIIRKMVKKEVKNEMEEVKLILFEKMSNHYFDFVKKQTKQEIQKTLKDSADIKIKSINLEEANQEDLTKLLSRGWRIVFFGDLKSNRYSNEPNKIILLSKYKRKKSKKKRNPK